MPETVSSDRSRECGRGTDEMKTWAMAAWFAACAGGALLFLKLVADGIALATRHLECFAERERTAARRRAEEEAVAKARERTRAA